MEVQVASLLHPGPIRNLAKSVGGEKDGVLILVCTCTRICKYLYRSYLNTTGPCTLSSCSCTMMTLGREMQLALGSVEYGARGETFKKKTDAKIQHAIGHRCLG